MARGGVRPGAGRPRGSPSSTTSELMAHLKVAEGSDLIERLSTVADAPTAPLEVRLNALRHLFGMFAGRTYIKGIERINDVSAI